MKLNINAKELLALYNALYERFDGFNGHNLLDYKDDDLRANDTTRLRQVYSRLRAIIVAGLTNPNKIVDPIDSWLKHESAKIDRLNDQNAALKDVACDPSKFMPVNPADILHDDEDEVPVDPMGCSNVCKGPPNFSVPYGGKHRGRRK